MQFMIPNGGNKLCNVIVFYVGNKRCCIVLYWIMIQTTDHEMCYDFTIFYKIFPIGSLGWSRLLIATIEFTVIVRRKLYILNSGN